MTAQDQQSRALLPCPFCGGDAEPRSNGFNGDMSMAACKCCGATAYAPKWNRRAPAAQVQAMGRVPPCPYPCGWDGLHKIAVADGAYLARTEWPEDEEGVSVKRATVMRNIGYLIDVCRALIAAAPRPPAAQEESNAR